MEVESILPPAADLNLDSILCKAREKADAGEGHFRLQKSKPNRRCDLIQCPP